MSVDLAKLVMRDPTVTPSRKGVLSPRLVTLDGKKVGVIWNGRPPGDLILDEMFRILRRRYAIKDVIVRSKLYVGEPAAQEVYDEIANTCDAAVTGVGD